MTDTTTEPTAEELAAAQAIVDRKAASDKAKIDAVLPQLSAFVGHERFAPLLADVTTLLAAVPAGPLRAHMNAILVGLTNLQSDVAKLTA